MFYLDDSKSTKKEEKNKVFHLVWLVPLWLAVLFFASRRKDVGETPTLAGPPDLTILIIDPLYAEHPDAYC